MCSKCVMDTSDPMIKFDRNGICDHCLGFKENVLPNWHPNRKGKVKLERIIENIKVNGDHPQCRKQL